MTEAPADTDQLDRIRTLLAELPRSRDRRIAEQLLDTVAEVLTIQPATADLKIASAALAEMTEAFEMFAPYDDEPKVTIFGSA